MNIEFALNPDEPAAQQLVDHVQYMVAIGVYRPGDDLPSAQVLAESLGISRPVVQTAYRTLEERDVTSAIRGGSTSIAQVADTRQHYARRMFSDAITVLRNLANPLEREQIRDAYLHEEERHFRSRRRPTEEEQPTE